MKKMDSHKTKVENGLGQPKQGFGLNFGVLVSHGEIGDGGGDVIQTGGFGDGRQRFDGRRRVLGVAQLVDQVRDAVIGAALREVRLGGQRFDDLQLQLDDLEVVVFEPRFAAQRSHESLGRDVAFF